VKTTKAVNVRRGSPNVRKRVDVFLHDRFRTESQKQFGTEEQDYQVVHLPYNRKKIRHQISGENEIN
jgi:hypothetical protein